MNRRSILKSAALLPLAACSTKSIDPAPTPNSTGHNRSLRFAYIGDTHVWAKSAKALDGMAKCFQHIQNQTDKPAFILHGGDVIMDALTQNQSSVQAQWATWHSIVKANNSLPIEYCIGNHDLWVFDVPKGDKLYGKTWAIEQMQISGRYRSFDRNGWHFIILDSVQAKPDNSWYTGYIDSEQFAWLRQDLAKTGTQTPIIIMAHIPIFSPTVFYSKQNVKNDTWSIPGGALLANTPDLLKLFYEYSNIKVVMSGHMHLLDQVQYNGVTYLCNGAVCGDWWIQDTFQQTKAGYALIDLYDDGTVERTYLQYE